MAVIKSYDSAAQMKVTANGQAQVSLYDPASGLPMVSFTRGNGIDLDTSANTDVHDVFAIGLPGFGGLRIGGTSTDPLRTDPTGTTTQPVSGSVSVANFPATTTVTGTVTANGTVAISNFPATQPVSGSVNVANFPATQPVSGSVTVANPVTSVAVNNLPTTQQVAGNVAVTNFPGTQTVAGSVGVNNFPSTQTVQGSVGINNFPNTQNISGTVTIGGIAMAAIFPVSVVDPDIGQSYAVAIDIVPTTVVSGTTYFSLRNSGSKIIYIARFDLQQGFTGTAAPSRSSFEFIRYVGTPSGGTTFTPAKKISGASASSTTVLSAATGLTTTGVTFDSTGFHRQTSANQLAATSTQDVTFADNDASKIQLLPGEGIAIRANGAVLLGAFLTGSVGWHER